LSLEFAFIAVGVYLFGLVSGILSALWGTGMLEFKLKKPNLTDGVNSNK